MRNVLRFSLSTFAIAAGVVVFSTPHLHAQRDDRRPGHQAGPQPIHSDAGYVFVDGDCIDAPYEVLLEGESFSINGQVYEEATFDLQTVSPPGGAGGRRGQGQRGARGPRGGGLVSGARKFVRDVGVLSGGGVVILETGRAPIVYGAKDGAHECLEFLLAKSASTGEPAVIPDEIDESTQQDWNRLAATVQMTPDFVARATIQVEELNVVRDKVVREFEAKRFGDRINYPMTMLAMVLVVFSAGHLMAMSQSTFSATAEADGSIETQRNIVKSLVIVALLSALDLIWTLVAHQSGSMRELNPIAGKLISNSTQLMVFKVSLTALALGLLFWLRNQAIARKATWWCCLVLTLLTVRWLTFHSMFA